MRKSKKFVASMMLFGFVIFMTVAGMIVGYNDSKTKFTGDVYINGTDVAGYTVDEANKIVGEKMAKEIEDININIIYKDKIWKFTSADFEINDAVKNVVNTAFRTNKISNRKAVEFVANRTGNFQTALNEIFKNFDQKIDDIASEIETEPVNAEVQFSPDKNPIFVVLDEKSGVKVDRNKLVCDLKNQFSNSKDITVYVHTDSIEPSIKSSYFDDKLNMQSTFTTSIKGSQAGRRNNVSVALKKINGTIIKPDEIVSFNQLTGPQNASGGYQDAIIINNGKFENGMGGGLCQASTTLYNACVLANLEIEEVHKHTLPVHYVELSLDAMVSDGYADLIFKNTSKDNIYIKSFVDGDNATVEIYGNSIPDGITIKRVAEFVGNIPHNGDKIVVDTDGEYSDKVLYKGEYYRVKWPAEGYEAKAFKEYYKNGKLVKREEIRHEKYQPQEGIVVEGAQELPEGFELPKQDVTIIKPQKQS